MPIRKITPKRPSQVFAERMKELRNRKGWSQQDMANRLAEMGDPTDRATLARTESGGRGLSLDDALLYAAALDAAPAGLLSLDDDDAKVALGAKYRVRSAYVRRWLMGQAPLPMFADLDALDALSEEELLSGRVPLKTADKKKLSQREADERRRFYEASLPLEQWKAYKRPGVQWLVMNANAYAASAATDNRSRMKRYLDELAAEVERQRAVLAQPVDKKNEED